MGVALTLIRKDVSSQPIVLQLGLGNALYGRGCFTCKWKGLKKYYIWYKKLIRFSVNINNFFFIFYGCGSITL